MGLPGYWVVLFLRALVEHPAGCGLPLAQLIGGGRHRLRAKQRSRHPGSIVFVAACPTAHTLAYLPIAGHVTATVTRLATGSGGLTLTGRDSHPLDD